MYDVVDQVTVGPSAAGEVCSRHDAAASTRTRDVINWHQYAGHDGNAGTNLHDQTCTFALVEMLGCL